MVSVRQIIFSNIFIKINSFIIAFILWSILSSIITTTTWQEVPLTFFNIDPNITIKAPKSVKIKIMGKKKILDKIKKTDIFININAQSLAIGNNPYILTTENLFYSPSITLIDYLPRNLIINLQNNGLDK